MAIFPSHARYKARYSVHNYQCRQFAAGKYIVANGKFFIDPVEDPFIEAFIMTADQNEILAAAGIFFNDILL